MAAVQLDLRSLAPATGPLPGDVAAVTEADAVVVRGPVPALAGVLAALHKAERAARRARGLGTRRRRRLARPGASTSASAAARSASWAWSVDDHGGRAAAPRPDRAADRGPAARARQPDRPAGAPRRAQGRRRPGHPDRRAAGLDRPWTRLTRVRHRGAAPPGAAVHRPGAAGRQRPGADPPRRRALSRGRSPAGPGTPTRASGGACAPDRAAGRAGDSARSWTLGDTPARRGGPAAVVLSPTRPVAGDRRPAAHVRPGRRGAHRRPTAARPGARPPQPGRAARAGRRRRRSSACAPPRCSARRAAPPCSTPRPRWASAAWRWRCCSSPGSSTSRSGSSAVGSALVAALLIQQAGLGHLARAAGVPRLRAGRRASSTACWWSAPGCPASSPRSRPSWSWRARRWLGRAPARRHGDHRRAAVRTRLVVGRRGLRQHRAPRQRHASTSRCSGGWPRRRWPAGCCGGPGSATPSWPAAARAGRPGSSACRVRRTTITLFCLTATAGWLIGTMGLLRSGGVQVSPRARPGRRLRRRRRHRRMPARRRLRLARRRGGRRAGLRASPARASRSPAGTPLVPGPARRPAGRGAAGQRRRPQPAEGGAAVVTDARRRPPCWSCARADESATAASPRSPGVSTACAAARSPACSARTARASRRSSRSCPACAGTTTASCSSTACRCGSARRAPGTGRRHRHRLAGPRRRAAALGVAQLLPRRGADAGHVAAAPARPRPRARGDRRRRWRASASPASIPTSRPARCRPASGRAWRSPARCTSAPGRWSSTSRPRR